MDSVKKLINKVAKDKELPIELVRQIVYSQFKVMLLAAEGGKFESVKLRHLGKFTPKHWLVDKYKAKLANEQAEGDNTGVEQLDSKGS